MSANQSDRASGRRRELRADVLERLRAHTPLTDRLEASSGSDVGADLIKPLSPLRRIVRGDDDPPILVGIAIVTGDSTRENRQERKNLLVEGRVTCTDAALGAQGLAWFDGIIDEVEAVLTTHTGGWTAQGVTGGTFEPRWDEETNRHRAVINTEYQHWG